MTINDELKRLRAEAKELRQRNGVVERAWEAQKEKNERLEEEVKAAKEEAARHRDRAAELERENASLKSRLGMVEETAKNLAGMIFKPHRRKPSAGSGRRRGAQPGHTGHGRKKPGTIDRELRVFLTHCHRCGNPLGRTGSHDTRVVEDIPDQHTVMTRYEIERQWCTSCHEEVRAVPPGTIPGMRLGLNAVVMILALKYRLRTPLERIAEILQSRYGLGITSGGIQDMLHHMNTRFQPQYQEILQSIRNAPVKHADETSFRIDGINAWCWLFAIPDAALYTIEETRGKDVPAQILGANPTGVLVRDDYAAYDNLPMEQQSCWAHLLRVSHDAAARDGASGEVQDLHQELTRLHTDVHALTETEFNLPNRQEQFAMHCAILDVIIARAYAHDDTRAVQTRIANQRENLLTALLHEHVPLTNNHAERLIRPMVVTRKISGGPRSNEGAATHAVNMSIMQTLSLQGKAFFQGIKDILSATDPRYALGKTE
jgi:transposase